MNEYPVFIPSRGRRIAAVITVPDVEPRGVVLMATGGGGVPRSHRYTLWTKVARALADKDIASVRWEWSGIADSTGELDMGFRNLPVDDAVSIARFAQSAVGTTEVGMFGQCMGGRTLLRVAIQTGLTPNGVSILFLKPLERTHNSGKAIKRARSWARKLPDPVRRIVRPLYRALPPPSEESKALEDSLHDVARMSDILLLEPPVAMRGRFAKLIASLNTVSQEHEVRVEYMPVNGIKELAPPEHQQVVIDAVAGWFDRRMPGAVADRAAAYAHE